MAGPLLGPDELVGVHHIAFTVTDLERTVDFYTSILGFELRSSTRLSLDDAFAQSLFGPGVGHDAVTAIAIVELNGLRVEFNQYLKPHPQPRHGDTAAGSAHLAIKVKDLERVRTRLEAAGIAVYASTRVFDEPGYRPWRWCYFRDPDGIFIELVEDMPVTNQLVLMAERLRAARRARGLTLKEVGGASGLSPTHLSQVERGEAIPSITALIGISLALSMTPDYFLRSEADHPAPSGEAQGSA
jgi:glyoxylase I family protein